MEAILGNKSLMMNIKHSRELSGGPHSFSNQFYIDLALQKKKKERKNRLKGKRLQFKKDFSIFYLVRGQYKRNDHREIHACTPTNL